jgi:GT2 family glycosyltransferase/glycosyltransferase involved in cell wall biosynthesis
MRLKLQRLVARGVRRLLKIAVKDGLNIQQEGFSGFQHPMLMEAIPPLNASDLLFLMDSASGRQEKPDLSATSVRASIIIPVFSGEVNYLFQCIRSLMREVDLHRDELILVNATCGHELKRFFSYLEGFVRVVESPKDNAIQAYNYGASVAAGKYLVFLDQNAVVLSGWLAHMLYTIEDNLSAGAVGSLRVDTKGRILEAGKIISRDGLEILYGSGETVGDSQFRYAREVDACGRGSLLIGRELFEKLGGFDERYTPKSYEDADLCFGVRSLGYKVIYQPASKVIQQEDAATDGAELKHQRETSRVKFVEKWRAVLEQEHGAFDSKMWKLAADRRRGPRIIVFEHKVPMPDRDAASLRMSLILKSLARWARPVLVPLYPQAAPDYEIFLDRDGVRVIYPPHHEDLLRDEIFDVAILSRPYVADVVFRKMKLKRLDRRLKIVFDTLDIHFLRLEREYKLTGDRRTAKLAREMKETEKRIGRLSDQIWCVTPEDAEVLDRELPGKSVKIVPTIHPLQERGKPFDAREGLLFIGSFLHSPNADAIHYLVREILPLIKEALPAVKVYVVGSDVPDEITAYNSDDVVVTGYVHNVDPYFHNCRVFVAPLRYGAGINGKVCQALSYGLPTVVSSIGAEGIGLKNGCEAMIVDDPREFARSVTEVYRNRELWEQLSEQGYHHIEQHFTPEALEKNIHEAITDVCAGRGRAEPEAGANPGRISAA